MHRVLVGVLALLLLLPAVRALADPQDKKPSDAYDALVKEFQESQRLAQKAHQEAKTDAERKKVEEEFARLPPSFAAKFLELAQKNPKDPVAVDAYLWVLQNASFTPEAEKAADAIAKDYLTDPKVKQAMAQLAHMPTAGAEKLLRGLVEKSTDKNDKARALNDLAQYLVSKAEIVETLKTADEEMLKQVETVAGKDFVQKLQKIDQARLEQEAAHLLDQLVQKYPEAKDAQGKLISDEAKGQLFVLRNLAIGKVAPEIEGEDIDGKKLKLSDYRGKVVVLDFWGNW
jgi:hypothetical protein